MPANGSSDSCSFCEKRGLLILPVRFAIATKASNAPKAYGNMLPQGCGPTPPDLGENAYYTTRVLRQGYLYVFDEKRNKWSGYLVTESGYFFPFQVGLPVSPALQKGREPCNKSGHQELASCITIPAPKEAGNVWLAYSEVEWTPRVLELHGDAGFRSRHMRKIDVQAALANLPADEPIRPVAKVKNTVAEYAAASVIGEFAKFPATWNPRVGQTKNLIFAAEQLYPEKGIVVALNDPTGITTDLAALMKQLAEEFLDKEDRRYHLQVNGWLNQIESQVKDREQRYWRDEAADEREYRASPTRAPTLFPATRAGYEASSADALSKMDSAAHLDAVAEESWKKYSKKIVQEERDAWLDRFKKDSKDYDQTCIAPLAKAHVEWMKGDALRHHMGCNYDHNEIQLGLAYVTTISACIMTTDDKIPCSKLYEDWLSEKEISDGNLLFKALTFNQRKLGKEIKGIGNSVSWEQLPWDKLNEFFDKVVKKLPDGTPDLLARLVGSLPGALARVLKKAVTSPSALACLVAVGVAGRQPIVRVEVQGSRRAFRASLIREMLRASGGSHLDRRAVAAELRRLECYGVSLHGTDTRHWLVFLNREVLKDMPANLTMQQRVKWLVKSIKTPEQIEDLKIHRVEQRVARAESSIRGAVSRASYGVSSGVFYAAPMAFAIVGIIANRVAWLSLLEEEEKSMRHVKSETLRRVWAQGAQLIGSVAVAIERGLKLLVLPMLKRSFGLGWLAKWLGTLGERIGTAGALAMSVLDFGRMGKEVVEGSWLGAFAFFVSGSLGIAATVAFCSGALVLGLALTLAVFVWAFVMTYMVDDKLQDWLERCAWGKLHRQRYGEYSLEEAELNKVVAG